MKATGIIVMFVCLFFAAAGPAAGEGGDRLPAVQVVEGSHEFAPLPEGRDVVHAYVIRNTGDAPLAIQKVRTG